MNVVSYLNRINEYLKNDDVIDYKNEFDGEKI